MEKDGKDTAKMCAITRILLREKERSITSLSLGVLSSIMTTTQCISHIVIHIHIQTCVGISIRLI